MKEKFKQCNSSDLEVGDVFTADPKSRIALRVVEVNSYHLMVRTQGKNELYPKKFPKNRTVIFLRCQQ